MKVRNKTTKKAVSDNAWLCKSVWSKAWGFMLDPNHKKCLIFEFAKPKEISVHNMLVFFSLDLFYLDGQKRVIEIKRSFLPWTLYFPRKKAKFLLEIPSLQKAAISLDDQLEWDE